jgi:hypothetical protein
MRLAGSAYDNAAAAYGCSELFWISADTVEGSTYTRKREQQRSHQQWTKATCRSRQQPVSPEFLSQEFEVPARPGEPPFVLGIAADTGFRSTISGDALSTAGFTTAAGAR